MRKLLAVTICLFLLQFMAGSADAAILTGQLKGNVSDQDGKPLADVEVVVSSPNMLGKRTIRTNKRGDFRVTELPPGSYIAQISHPGYNIWKAINIRIALSSTVALTVKLTPVSTMGAIEVIEEAPAVDVERTQVGATLDAQFLKDIPSSSRTYQSAMSLSSGVIGSGNANISGSFRNSNQFYVDGVNTTDPLTNTFSMNMNYDAIEEIQVITGGMDAEYGRSLGGAVNMVTKSGGNTFSGEAYVRYTDQNFEVYEPLEGEDPDSSDFSQQQYAINLGGPIVKDKLWFFVSTQMDIKRQSIIIDNADIGRPTGADPLTGDEMSLVPARDFRSRYLFTKLTYQPNGRNRIWIHAQNDPATIKNLRQSPYVLPSAEAVQVQGGWLGSVGHLWTPGSNFSLQTQFYVQSTNLDYFSVLWLECQQFDAQGVCQDDFGESWSPVDPDGFAYGEIPYASFNKRNRTSFTSKATYYLDNFLGHHTFKAGFEAEYLKSYYVYPGLDEGIEYRYYDNEENDPANLDSYVPYYSIMYRNNLETSIDGTLTSWYLQDVWQPLPGLTIRPGLRFDYSNLRNDVGATVFKTLNVAPRFGLAFDPTGNNQTNIHAYYGRFFDSGWLQLADLLVQNDSGYDLNVWTGEAYDYTVFSTYSSFLKYGEIGSPYSNEFDLGVTRSINDKASMDATWVRKTYYSFWEDDEVNQIWNADGTAVIGARNGDNTAIYRLRNPADQINKYDSLALTFERAWSDNWSMLGTYTWSKSTGTANRPHTTSLVTYGYDIPQQRQYESGYLSFDQTHSLKVAGSYRNPNKWTLGSSQVGYLFGWDFRLTSGFPYRKTYYNAEFYGWSNFQAPNDGDLRLPASSTTDLKGGLIFSTGPMSWTLMFEVYNAFNERTVTSVNQSYGNTTGDGVYVDANGDPIFGTALNRMRPRRFLVGLRGEF